MAASWWQRALRLVSKPCGGKLRNLNPCRVKLGKFTPWLEFLEDKTMLTGPATSPGVTLITVPATPPSTTAISAGDPGDIPGLVTNVPAAGAYRISAAVTFQNASPSAGTQVGVELVVNGQAVESRALAFAPNSQGMMQSIDLEDDLSLSANDLVEVKARVASGSAEYPGSEQDLRLIRFNDIPGSGPLVAFMAVPATPPPTTAISAGDPGDIPGLVTNVPAAGAYRISAAVTFQNASPAAGTQVGVELVVNGQPIQSRALAFAPNSQGAMQSLSLEDNLSLSANDLVEVKARVASGSAEYPGNEQDLLLIRFATPPVVAGPGNQSSLVGSTIQLAITASDAENGPLTYAASGLPAGLAINRFTGVISGTIGNQAARPVPYTVTVTANDGFNSGNTSFTWTVANVPTAVSPPPPPPHMLLPELVHVRVGKKVRLMIAVFDQATGAEVEALPCPFQSPAYQAITLTPLGPDLALLSARKGKHTVTALLPF